MTSNKFVVTLLLVLVAIFTIHAQDALHPYEAVEPHMGTLFRINLYAPDEASARQAFQAAFQRIDELDKSLSDYRADSELSRISRGAMKHPVRVSEDLFRVAQASQQLSMRTDGAFDLTIGPLSHLWRQARRDGALPNPEAVQSARARCGYTKMHVDAAQRTIEFDQPEMLLDGGELRRATPRMRRLRPSRISVCIQLWSRQAEIWLSAMRRQVSPAGKLESIPSIVRTSLSRAC